MFVVDLESWGDQADFDSFFFHYLSSHNDMCVSQIAYPGCFKAVFVVHYITWAYRSFYSSSEKYIILSKDLLYSRWRYDLETKEHQFNQKISQRCLILSCVGKKLYEAENVLLNILLIPKKFFLVLHASSLTLKLEKSVGWEQNNLYLLKCLGQLYHVGSQTKSPFDCDYYSLE